jgi:hypothetical protein
MAHPVMSKEEWESIYQESWKVFFSPEHMKTVMRRAAATGISAGKILFLLVWYYGCAELEKIHPLQGGYLRRKYRTDRRPSMQIENPFVFYPRYFADLVYKHVKLGIAVVKYGAFRRALRHDPAAASYMDTALTPVTEDDFDSFELFTVNDAARTAADKARHPGLSVIA